MGQAKATPQDDILVQHIVVSRSSICNTTNLILAQQSIPTTSIQLVVLVLSNPEMMLGEQSTSSLSASRVCEQLLCSGCDDLVGNRLARNRVELVRVLNLKDPIVQRLNIVSSRLGDRDLTDFVEVALRVGVRVHRHRQTLFLDDGIAAAVDSRVDSHTEHMLMVLRQRSWVNDIAPRRSFALVNVDDRNNTGCAGLHHDSSSLVELEVEDVFVVGKGDDELDNQFSAASNDSSTGSPVGMLPVDAIILLMKTDDILGDLGLTLVINKYTIKVLEHISLGSMLFRELNLP